MNPDIDQTYSLEWARPIESHARIMMEWRNDPETLRNSYHQTPKVWDTFYPYFLKHYFTHPDLPPLFVWENGKRVAFLRFQPAEDPLNASRICCDISINVAPESRGRGVGKKSIMLAIDFAKMQGIDDLYAEIKIENTPSQRAFEAVGFRYLGKEDKAVFDTGENVSIVCYMYQLTPVQEDYLPVFIIAEAGSNWRMGTPARDRAMAKALIEEAAKAGADAVKFQVFNPDSIYVPNAGTSDYLSESGVREEMTELFKDLAMPHEMLSELSKWARDAGIQLMATPFSADDFNAVNPYVQRHKIASYEIGHIHLIKCAAEAGKPLYLSTGAATIDEIAWAVDTYDRLGGKKLTLMQCTARYPAEPGAMNLNAIPWLKSHFRVPVGLSDHSRDPLSAPTAAAALGATVIEKHFTLHNALPGPDHAFAVQPHEFKQMVQAVRAIEPMLGSRVKYVHPVEEELRRYARRGVQAIQPIAVGDQLREGVNIAILRPGKQKLGAHPLFMPRIEGHYAKRAIETGDGIQKNDF